MDELRQDEAGKEAVIEARIGNVKKPESRLLYILSTLIITISGVCIAVAGAFAAGIDSVTDINVIDPRIPAEEIELYYYRLGEFSSRTAKADFFGDITVTIVVACILFLAGIVRITMQAGRFKRTENGSVELNFWDRLWSEIHLAIIAVCAFVALRLAWLIYGLVPFSNWISIMKPISPDPYYYGISNNTVLVLCICGIIACILIAEFSYASLVKKVKARDLFRGSLIGKTLLMLGIGAKYAGTGILATGRGIRNSARGAMRSFAVPSDSDRRATSKIIIKNIFIALALITMPYSVSVALGGAEWGLLVLLISAVIAIALVVHKLRRLCEIRYGAIEVSTGNLSYKINVNSDDNGPKTDLDHLAAAINSISDAMNIAVQNEVKNQRLKTDLISNVSHDLKTPLTSMITYLDILEKEGLDSPDASSHLAIVREKTDRLRTLTEELFEAAKASSGNMPCEIEDIDLVSIIDQTLAELEVKLENKGLKVIKNFKTETAVVRADGRLLYRVLENLLGNISKYALENSRVYIDVTRPASWHDKSSGKLLLEIKNISKDELNISADELKERFTRGDSSRNTEGSGLGLAIAKDLTTIMDGDFKISIDGDMFKASILLTEARK